MLSTTLSTFGSSFVVTCSRKIERRLLSVKFDLSLFLFMFIIKNICSHKYVPPNSDNNRQAKSLTLPYVLELRLPWKVKMLFC